MPNYQKGVDFVVAIETAVPGIFDDIACVRATSLAINTEQIDVTSKCVMPDRTLIEGGIHSMTLSGDGVMNDGADITILISAANAGSIVNMRLTSGLGDDYEGPFHVGSFERTGDYNDAEMFSFTFESAAKIIYSAP